MREFWINIIKVGGARVYVLLAGMITLVLTARWLGPEGRGMLAAVITWASLISTLSSLSLGQVALKHASSEKGNSWLGPAIGSLGILTGAITIISISVALLLYLFSEGRIYGDIPTAILATGLLLIPFKIWELYGSSLLMALEMVLIYNRYQVIGYTISILLLIVFLLLFDWGIYGALSSTISAQIIVSLGVLFYLLRKSHGHITHEWEMTKSFIKGGIALHLTTIGAVIINASDILMVNYYLGLNETAFYQLAVQLIAVFLIIPQAASMLLFGKVSTLGPDAAWKFHRKILKQSLLAVLATAIIAGLTANWWIIWIAGEAFSPSTEILQWRLLGLISGTFSIILASQWIGRGLFIYISMITFTIALGNIVANAILIPKFGVLGAVWATLAVGLIGVIANISFAIFCEKKWKLSTNHD